MADAPGGMPRVGDDEGWMDDALVEARAALKHDDVPVGAVVVRDGTVIGRGHNSREGDQDPTAHAEILALRDASTALGRWRLDDCAMYVTVEPCAMCAGAAILARLGLVVFGTPEPRTGAVVSVTQLLDEPALNHHPKWRMGARRAEAEALLSVFFQAHRASDKFGWREGDIVVTPADGQVVTGEPALFFSKSEKEWRRTIAAAGAKEVRALALEFTVASYKRGGSAFDIDNLCKPVLDELGWTPDTIWARVAVGAVPGLRIFESAPPPAPTEAQQVRVSTPPTRSRRTTGIPELAGLAAIGGLTDDLGVELTFGSPNARIHDFGFEGPIKPLIDGMFVLLGGVAHRPADHRIKDLRIRRAHEGDDPGVTIAAWPLQAGWQRAVNDDARGAVN